MIWDFIRDFLVQYIFGGVDSNGQSFGGAVGLLNYYADGSWETDAVGVNAIWYKINDTPDGLPYYISLGDWLSTTTTIIIMCVIVFLFALLVRWIFKAVTSAFLLK